MWLARLQSSPSWLVSSTHVAEIVKLVESGSRSDRLARQVVEDAIPGEDTLAEVVAVRGLELVSDSGPLMEAIDAALAAQPDALEKIRDGRLQTAGAVIGAVMKSMGGKADAARVRALVLERAAATS